MTDAPASPRIKITYATLSADLQARITDSLDELCGPGGRGGHGPAGGDGATEDGATPSTAPSAGTSSDA